MEKILNFIDGEFRASSEGKFLEKIDPSTGQVSAQVADSSDVDVVLAIQAANKAFSGWRELKASERAQWLRRIAAEIEAHADRLVEAESRDTGKPLWLAREMDIARAAQNFLFFASRIEQAEEMATDMDGEALNYTLRQPLGVAGLIAPWNLPLYLMTWKIAPAIAAGNTVVCKPSELTPTSLQVFCELLRQISFPKGVINVVHGRGDVAGAALVRHPGVPVISFTGGTATGVRIQELAAPQIKKLSLELGGKNATIVLKDMDLRKVIPAVVRSSFLNQGEICLCGSKILVQEDLYPAFLDAFATAVRELKVGDRRNKDTFLGPVISKAHYDKVTGCINLAKKDGGKIITGEEPLELPSDLKGGYFIRPTVIADLTNCSELHQTEIFGPVVTVSPFKYPHEAVKWANNSPYGLSASVWTNDITKAHKIARDLQVGTVWVNTWLKRDLRVPFGGVKASGIGREGGDYSLDFFSEVKTVCVQL